MNVFLVRFITWRYKVNEYGLISQIPTGLFNNSSQIIRLSATEHIGGLYKVFWDTGYWPIFWDICVFYFGVWDIQEFRDMGYWNLFWDTS